MSAARITNLVFLIVICFGFSIVSAQSAVPPIAEDTCLALKSIANSTESSTIAECMVEDGCAVLNCINPPPFQQGSAKIKLNPCTYPPSISVKIYDSMENFVSETNISATNSSSTTTTDVAFGSLGTFFFTVQQENEEIPDALNLKVEFMLDVPNSAKSLFISQTMIPINASVILCSIPPQTSTTTSSQQIAQSSCVLTNTVTITEIMTTLTNVFSTTTTSEMSPPIILSTSSDSTVSPSSTNSMTSNTANCTSGCTKMSAGVSFITMLIVLTTVWMGILPVLT